MPYRTYPYQLPPLPYAYNALEPYIDAETMYYHHDKHFRSYVDNLNHALAPYPCLQSLTLEELLRTPGRLPAEARCAILRNGGGVYNHTLYFQGLAPACDAVHQPRGIMAELLCQTYGSVEEFKKAFEKEALAVFGSGWAVLALTPRGRLRIVQLKNQDTLLCTQDVPLLYADVWEHAYYLKYKNQRGEYLENLWNLLVFPTLR